MKITRFPPSPTGDLHIGGVRTALYNWLIAQKNNGKMILRIEDTDTKREKKEAVAGILEGMQWLGLNWDEGPYFQTERLEKYQKAIQTLLDNDSAYPCYCTKERLDTVRESQMKNKQKPKYDGRCRNHPKAVKQGIKEGIKPVIRFKTPQTGSISWKDSVHDTITFKNDELDDLIIQRSDGTPTYHLCVVVDDVDMKITDIVRGDDHINNTPRQLHIFNALNADIPNYGHIGMILNDQGKKLSKRHGAASVLAFREAGYLPEALLNYLVRLGWSYGDQEIFSITEMIENFDISAVNKSASSFNTEKLNWLNQHYLKTLPAEKILPHLNYHYQKQGIFITESQARALIPCYAERAKTLVEFVGYTDWVFNTPSNYPEKTAKKAFHSHAAEYLTHIKQLLLSLDSWQQRTIHQCIEKTVSHFETGFGKVGMPLRLALTGGKPSPNIDEIIMILGKNKSIDAIDHALDFLSQK